MYNFIDTFSNCCINVAKIEYRYLDDYISRLSKKIK